MWWHSLGEHDLPEGRAWLSPRESDVESALRYTKRRNEWLLARWTAKQTVAHLLGVPPDSDSLAGIEIRTVLHGPAQGAPEVFVDGARATVAVSLTDRAGWAVCTAGDQGAIGCDLELVEPRSEWFVQDFLTVAEQALVAEPPWDAPADVVANLIWSAKESALKVLRTGLRRATRSVEVGFGPGIEDGWRELVVRGEEGVRFPGWWSRYGLFLLTVIASDEDAPPTPLLPPPRLVSAEPSHTWMDAPAVGWDSPAT